MVLRSYGVSHEPQRCHFWETRHPRVRLQNIRQGCRHHQPFPAVGQPSLLNRYLKLALITYRQGKMADAVSQHGAWPSEPAPHCFVLLVLARSRLEQSCSGRVRRLDTSPGVVKIFGHVFTREESTHCSCISFL
jgi:hypothetical protein